MSFDYRRMDKLYCYVTTSLLLLLAGLEAVSINAVHFINDNTTFKKYLCSPNHTITPHTELVINVSKVAIDHRNSEEGFNCRVENTSNITITASNDLILKKLSVLVECKNPTGFRFWNVSSLAIKSVCFKNCGNKISSSIMSGVETSLFLYNCRNLMLHNVLAVSSSHTQKCDPIDLL